MAAGVAIENARPYEIAQDRRQWMAANAEVVGELLSGTEEMDVLHGIVRHAGSILRADLGALALPMDGGGLRVVIATGVGAENLAERAELRGGRLEPGPAPHGGTRLVW